MKQSFICAYWIAALILLSASLLSARQLPQLGKNTLREVVAAMTLEEKVSMVLGTGMHFPGMPPEMKGPDVGEITDRVPGSAGMTFPIPRLGIPSAVLADGPAGLRIQPYRNNDSTASYFCTAFPIATLLASTWDTDLVERVGRAIGNELREYGVDVLLAPAMNIHRNPLGGRNFEYYSEDPLVSGRMAAAMVKGVQSQGAGASLKHFAANNHEWNRNTINVKAGERALREIYLRGFEIAVREAGPWTVMTSYNKINGTYTSESPDLLLSILRGDWKFGGLVMTDWFGGQDPVAQMKAGNDLLMPGMAVQQKKLLAAVRDKTLDEAVLDRNLENILKMILKSPSFAGGGACSNKPDLKAHARIAREAAAEGMVLLKNERKTLPLKPGSTLALFGNAAYEMATGGTGSGDVNEAYSISLLQGLKDTGFSVDDSLAGSYRSYLTQQKAILPKPSMPFMPAPPIPERIPPPGEIDGISAKTDIGLMVIGRNSGEFLDRRLENDFCLSDAEKRILRGLSAAYHFKNKKVVVILNIGGVIETAAWRDLADAILCAWQPGQEAGSAIADVLSGKVNPSGRLATTFPVNYGDTPSSSNFPGTVLEGPDPNNRSFMAGARAAEVLYKEGIWIGYRYFNSKNIKTAYPFGFGLSYTDFQYGNVTFDSKIFRDQITSSVTVKNTGNTAGKEVVQLYISAPAIKMEKPEYELKAFAKTGLLQPGESETMTFVIHPRDLASFDTQRTAWVAEKGEYRVIFGSSSTDVQQTGSFKLPGELTVEKLNKALAPKGEI